MRELTFSEMALVAGGSGECTPDNSGDGNTFGGVSEPKSLGDDLINIYEGLIAATSYVIERVANAL